MQLEKNMFMQVTGQGNKAKVVFQTGSIGCVLSFNQVHPIILSRLKEPQMDADERRSIVLSHRKVREERKAEEQKSLRPLRSLRLIEFHGG